MDFSAVANEIVGFLQRDDEGSAYNLAAAWCADPERGPIVMLALAAIASGTSASDAERHRAGTSSPHKDVVEEYLEGFRRSDNARVLALLTDDVVWDLPGFQHVSGSSHLEGKDAFRGEIENEAFVGSPILTVDRLVEEGDTVVALGTGETSLRTGERYRFAFCDVFTFRHELIARVEAYVVTA